jgi:RNA polymerase sigma-70 factor, ECF subfamily
VWRVDRCEESHTSGGAVAIATPQCSAESPLPQAVLPSGWFHSYVDLLWRVVTRLGVPAHSAEDIVQECFMVASRRRADIVAGRERRFLVATAVRLSANYRRLAFVRHEVAQTEWVDQCAPVALDAEQLLCARREQEQLQQLLLELPAARRCVFVLYELEGFTVPEIAELLGVPLGTVASRLGRARSQFSQAAQALQEKLATGRECP